MGPVWDTCTAVDSVCTPARQWTQCAHLHGSRLSVHTCTAVDSVCTPARQSTQCAHLHSSVDQHTQLHEGRACTKAPRHGPRPKSSAADAPTF